MLPAKLSKAQKRKQNWIEKQFKKERRVEIYEKLGKLQKIGNLKSSAKLGKQSPKVLLDDRKDEEEQDLMSTDESDVDYDENLKETASKSLIDRAFKQDELQVFEADHSGCSNVMETLKSKPPKVEFGGALRKPGAKPNGVKKTQPITQQSIHQSSDSDSSEDDESIPIAKGSSLIPSFIPKIQSTASPTPPVTPLKAETPATPATPAFYVKVSRKPEIETARLSLPIVGEEQLIMETITHNPVTILCGETGSGKTTQLPQFLYEAGFGDPNHPDYPGMIAITQPRRVAAVSMASRVLEELNCDKDHVSYQIRYDSSNSSSKTRIKFMTDGILLAQLSKSTGVDMLLPQYSCIIIDEAHERTVGTDILIGWLTRIVNLRNSKKIANLKPLKLVIMSATLRVDDFTQNKKLFDIAPPVVEVEGRQHKVVIHYNRKTPDIDYLSEAYKKIVKIHTKLPPGGVLVFVTGQQEVNILVKKLGKKCKSAREVMEGGVFNADVDGVDLGETEGAIDDYHSDESDGEEEKVDVLPGSVEEDEEVEETTPAPATKKMHILPLYSMLPTKEQLKVFDEVPEGHRLIVIATNVAETSLTIPGIRYVVDCGKVKERCFDTQTGIQNFKVTWTSSASADQRAGRAGRLGPGHCYRLFSSAVFTNYFEKFSKPEILRIPIPGVVLSMKSMGISQVVGFPFPTPPDSFQLKDSEVLLKHLEAVDPDLKITNVGKLMAQFPLSPRYAKMLVVAAKQAPSVLRYIIAIVAGLSVGEIFLRDMDLLREKKEKKPKNDDAEEESTEEEDPEERKEKRGLFFKTMQMFIGDRPSSDLLTMLTAIGAYLSQPATNLESFCATHFLREKQMDEVSKLIQQLGNISKTVFKIELDLKMILRPPTEKEESLIRQIILSGYVDCIALLDPNNLAGYGKHALPVYQTIWSLPTEQFVIHSSSSIFRERPPPKWIVFDQIQGKQEMYGADGSLLDLRSKDGFDRKFLKNVTVIKDSWILNQVPAMTNEGKMLEQPEPRYHADSDTVKGFIAPTLGPKFWPLPMTEKLLESGKEASAWFAKSLLEGQVDFGVKISKNPFHILLPYLTTKPSVITKSWAINQPKVARLLQDLVSNNIASKKQLLALWKTKSNFLLSSYLLWVPTEFHATLTAHWPPVLEEGKVDMNNTRRFLILDSSFNPLHNGHLKMLQLAEQKFINHSKILLLSTANADKQVNNFHVKLEMLQSLNDNSLVVKTCSGRRFIDKTKLFDGRQVYLMGYDTITRFFDKKYYDDYENDMKSFFDVAEICVFDRGDCAKDFWEREEMKAVIQWKSKITVFEKLPGVDISSTIVRNLIREYYKTGNGLDRLKEMVPARILHFVLERKLYEKE